MDDNKVKIDGITPNSLCILRRITNGALLEVHETSDVGRYMINDRGVMERANTSAVTMLLRHGWLMHKYAYPIGVVRLSEKAKLYIISTENNKNSSKVR